MKSGAGIPPILHVTWKSLNLPRRMRAALESWRRINPGLEIRLWDDAMIRDLIARVRPDRLARFDGYKHGIQRADMFRYVVLGEIGGIYADLDITALRPAGELFGKAGAFVALEPQGHAEGPGVRARGFPFLACNALMGSVPGHPLWAAIEDGAWRLAAMEDVIDSTGPYMLTGLLLGLPEALRPDLLHPGLWSPRPAAEQPDLPFTAAGLVAEAGFRLTGSGREQPVTDHAWNHVWWKKRPAPEAALIRIRQTVRARLRRWRQGPLEFEAPPPQAPILCQALRTASERPRIAIAAPLRDAERHLPAWRGMVEAFDYPPDRLSVALLEGDSTDRTWAAAQDLADDWRGRFAGVRLARRHFGHHPPGPRWLPEFQRIRRGNIAACRNDLASMTRDADYTLFLDADVTEAPAGLLALMLGSGAEVTMANCLDERGIAYDLNAFVYQRRPGYAWLAFSMADGILQPRPGKPRLYMADVPYLQKMPLDCVGGTCLLVDNRVFAAGVNFPVDPYRLHVETEGFGLKARGRGFRVIGLPNVIVTHPRHGG